MLKKLLCNKRLFSTAGAAESTRNGHELLYARRSDNGQGSSFVFRGNQPQPSDDGSRIDVSYSTFWNDFSHYSFYGEPTEQYPAVRSTPLAYNNIVGKATEDLLFADKEKFVDGPNSNTFFNYDEQPYGENKREVFTYQRPDSFPSHTGHFCAHIPQDFNIDVQTSGEIIGVCPGDSKLLSLTVRLESELGGVTARKMRCDECDIKAHNQVQIISSLEAGQLTCSAGQGGFSVGKRFGIGKKGRVDSAGRIKIGSIFSKMRDIAESLPIEF